MALLLGIDTGGTFTDAVVLDNTAPRNTAIVASAKALTTRHDLAIGIGGAASAALQAAGCNAGDIKLVSLSTTLATNALVEGQGGRVALIAIGFAPKDLERAGLADALGSDPLVILPGGHTTHGAEQAPLDLAALETQLDELAEGVAGFAVAGYFAVRNPAHELAVRELLLSRTDRPVTCSHELSAQLNGPKRALTTVLNARLIPMITRLIDATTRTLDAQGIDAPVMVVRGDGALVGADFASRRPIETILSGPAASLVGALWLTGEENAFVNDIGGTTSDVAVLENGRPRLDPAGAQVGAYRTMVEAVAMHTFGLGGDSQVCLGGTGLAPMIELGPRRVVPISLLAVEHGDAVHHVLDEQLKSTLVNRNDGGFAMRSGTGIAAGLSSREQALFDRLADAPLPLDRALQATSDSAALDRLVERGLVLRCGLTPSDALHALDQQDVWDKEAAVKMLTLFGRVKDGTGKPVYGDPVELARMIVARVERRSAEVVLQTAFAIDGQDPQAVHDPLIASALDRRVGHDDENSPATMAKVDVTLGRPLIGLGASAHAWHPAAARLLGTNIIVPPYAGVANAVGAVVGQVSLTAKTTVSQPAEGHFAVTGLDQPFPSEDTAVEAARSRAKELVEQLASDAGAQEIRVTLDVEERRAQIEGRDVLVEAVLTARATGRPPIAG
ncbi:hydantoinase/oxoprolinase N-terminal domain-containing protein [Ahrensia sp. R2A130]|uniref:hydantoinase/oxoprolinase N-terminal domain-containing protein n=1 Tax=Ahrensia sp. R2A130 TaxID=744979 RepID=UPI0001E0CA4E|nr:hydantoinase/oxoprolinase family protein [Ahrensia sp. R2A130]EFL87640.1 hydantoinase [Ahrensia sp. R2A130]